MSQARSRSEAANRTMVPGWEQAIFMRVQPEVSHDRRCAGVAQGAVRCPGKSGHVRAETGDTFAA